MQSAPIPENEDQRLKALKDLDILDTLPEDVYDDITRLASEICGTPISLLTLIDKDRQWFKSAQGSELERTPREQAFCAYTILNPDEVLIVPDARYDERFHDNPLTTGEPKVIFYAGVPVKDPEGNAVGSLCVIDNRPRELTEQKIESLKALAKLVNCHFDLRKKTRQIEENKVLFQQIHTSISQVKTEVDDLMKLEMEPRKSEHISRIKDGLNNIVEKIDAQSQ